MDRQRSDHSDGSDLTPPKKDKRDTKDKRGARDEDNDSVSSYSSKERPLKILESKTEQVKSENTNYKDHGKRRYRKTIGRIDKRRRFITKRKYTVRKNNMRRRTRHKEAKLKSSCSIFTKISSKASGSTGCKFCGHQYNAKRCSQRIKRKRRRARCQGYKRQIMRRDFRSRGIQVGSRCQMFSPLYVGPANLAEIGQGTQNDNFVEISPEMIYDSLRQLTMWKQTTLASIIHCHIKRHYPVNPHSEQLMEELMFKLYVAEIAGIVMRCSHSYSGQESWRVSCRLQNRYLTDNHVTLFWQIYNDTMTPVQKKRGTKPTRVSMKDSSNTMDRYGNDVI